ncbi:alpha/beta hydrolase [Flavobacterium sp. RHBU_3]|uniref:alpha/beta hydrolase n=1 Tax=Flavobacterium sp. RHBU_3 TaxID=3391184 RepID=UPI003984EE93
MENTKNTAVNFSIHSPQFGSERKIWVHLPVGYNTNDFRYPVVYMNDGQHVFGRAEEKFSWIADERLKHDPVDAIIIGIEHGKNRIAEMTPFRNEEHGGGNADVYLDFVINTLKPYIDSHYRTLPESRNTGIFGSSIGGLLSFYAVLKHPYVFGSAVAFSPSFWFGEKIYTQVENTPEITGRIYLMAGDRESHNTIPDLERMEQLALARIKDKSRLYKKIVHNGQHNEKLWRKEMIEALRWIIAG